MIKRSRVVLSIGLLSAVFACVHGMDVIKGIQAAQALAAEDESEGDSKRFIGYGYDAFNGPVYKSSSYHLNYPILNLSAAEGKIKVFNFAQTEYTNKMAKSKKEVSESLSKENAGGASASAQAQIGPFSANASLSTIFNMSGTEQWSSIQNEEFSYYNIKAKTKNVVLQIDTEDLYQYLDPNFLKAASKISTEQQASDFFDKYGTHLMTGYELGGIFQMTNYYATNTSSHVRQQTLSFSAQVDAGLSYARTVGASTSANYSFSQQYGIKDNDSESVNLYKLSTYGGDVFPGLTIDQAFSYYESSALVKGGYLYQLWTDSINEGRNNVIVGAPATSPMVPLYQLLPSGGSYATQRSLLLNQYIKTTQKQMNKSREENKDAIYTDMVGQDYGTPSATLNGYTKYSPLLDSKSENKFYYAAKAFSASDNDEKEITIQARVGDRFSLNYYLNNCEGYGFKWFLKNSVQSKYLEAIGSADSSGNAAYDAFKINENADGQTIYLIYGNAVDSLKTIKLVINNSNFIDGSGKADDPYIITKPSELCKMRDGTDKSYRLGCDIDMSSITDFIPIGKEGSEFTGTFDGDGHTISGLRITDSCLADIAFDCTNENCKDDKAHKCVQLGLFGNVGSTGKIQNVTLKDAKINITKNESNYFLWNAGVLCGRNQGKISNCFLTGNCELIYSDPSPVENVRDTMSFGGICGMVAGNSSDIKKCGVEGVTISATRHANLYSCIGGVTGGINANNGTVSQCFAKECTITNNFSLANKDGTLSYNGGIAGYVTQLYELSDCLNRDTKFNVTCSETNGGTFAIGGLIGTGSVADSDDSSLKLLSNCLSNQESGGFPDLQVKGEVLEGSCVGWINYGGSRINDYFSNVYGYGKGGLKLVGKCGDKIGTDNFTTIKKTTNITGLTGVWTGDNYDSKDLKTQTVSCVTFNFDEAKTEFVKGEPFYAGDIYATKEFADGSDPEDFENFFIDYSEFDSAHAGTYEIKVSAYGYNDSYSVTVREPNMTLLKAELNTTKTYLQGDEFDKGDIVLTAFYEDGTSQVIDAGSANVKYAYSNGTSVLAQGQNKISITYNNLSCYVVVDAEENYAKSFEITKSPNKMSYSTKDKSIDLSGMEIEVAYSNPKASVKRVAYDNDESKFASYYCRFVEGENDIGIGYSDCEIETLTVVAEAPSVTVDQVKLNAFVSSTNLLDGDFPSLEAYRNAIIVSKEARISLLSEYDESVLNEYEDYRAAKEKLESAIKNYKDIANSINGDFDSAIEVSSRIGLGIPGGLSSLLAVLGAILTIFFAL